MLRFGENTQMPALYSFRRCPYAMRARLALHLAGTRYEHREILLRDKPPSMLAASPKGTVPVLVTPTQTLDESLDIMLWASGAARPRGLDAHLVQQNDGPFKHALDRYKYASRYGEDPLAHRAAAVEILERLDTALGQTRHLTGDTPRLPDYAIFPFIRQFANADRPWFDSQPWPHLQRWLDHHLASGAFAAIMVKHPLWSDPLAPGAQSPQD